MSLCSPPSGGRGAEPASAPPSRRAAPPRRLREAARVPALSLARLGWAPLAGGSGLQFGILGKGPGSPWLGYQDFGWRWTGTGTRPLEANKASRFPARGPGGRATRGSGRCGGTAAAGRPRGCGDRDPGVALQVRTRRPAAAQKLDHSAGSDARSSAEAGVSLSLCGGAAQESWVRGLHPQKESAGVWSRRGDTPDPFRRAAH